MAGMGSSAMGMTPNRQKYQSNEYITDAGLNWMSFGARQYDPQLGRFLSVDPLADAGGQDFMSPYAAMGNEPISMTDPDGTMTGQPGGNLPTPPGGRPPVLASAFVQTVVGPPGGLWQVAIDGPLMGFSDAALADMAGNINTDPMNLEGQMAGGFSGDVVTLYGQAAQALFSLLQGASSFSITGAGLEMNFSNGDNATFGFNGQFTSDFGSSASYACEGCSSMQPADATSTKIMKTGLTLAGATMVVGLGPEDPVADVVSGGILVGAAAAAGVAYLIEHPEYSLFGLMHSWMSSDGRTAGEIIQQDRKGSINREFPDQYRNKTLKEIENAAKTDRTAKKALKLLKDGRFKK